MEPSSLVSLKIVLNLNNGLEIINLSVPPSACYSFFALKVELTARISEIRDKDFQLFWIDENEKKFEILCDASVGEVFESSKKVTVLYVDCYVTPAITKVEKEKTGDETNKLDLQAMMGVLENQTLLNLIPSLINVLGSLSDDHLNILIPKLQTFLDTLSDSEGGNVISAIEDFVEIFDQFERKKQKQDRSNSAVRRKSLNDFVYEGLDQLRQMGFSDDSDQLLHLLHRYNGNVIAVVNAFRTL